jgi:hypothetical protein
MTLVAISSVVNISLELPENSGFYKQSPPVYYKLRFRLEKIPTNALFLYFIFDNAISLKNSKYPY